MAGNRVGGKTFTGHSVDDISTRNELRALAEGLKALKTLPLLRARFDSTDTLDDVIEKCEDMRQSLEKLHLALRKIVGG